MNFPIWNKLSVNAWLSLALLVLALPVGVLLVRQQTRVPSSAQTAVSVYFSPSSANLPPDVPVQVLVNAAANQIGFVRVDFNFDRSLVNLSSEITPSSVFKTVVQKTSMATANNTGAVTMVLALAPEDRVNPPTGVIQLASFSVTPVTANSNLNTSVTINGGSTQVVDMATNALAVSGSALNLTLNPVSAPAATNTPPPNQINPTNTPVLPIPTATPTLAPGETPAPTLTPEPGGGGGTPNSCNGTCGSNANCQTGLTCYLGYCRNPDCPSTSSCGCNGSTYISPTPRPTPTPYIRPTLAPRPTIKPVITVVPSAFPTVPVYPTFAPQPTPIPEPILTFAPADVNMDGCVNFGDLKLVIEHFGEKLANVRWDVNNDGRTNLSDMFAVLRNWGEGCNKK